MKRKVISLILCIALVISILPTTALAARDVSYEETLAQKLKALGLFKGVSDTEFALDRAPTRVEALIMLIRTLGEEGDALGGAWTHPFTDVESWANRYVGYGYQNGLTKGVSATEFGNEPASAAMFLTFMLRALGYSDSGSSPDFAWDNPFTLAEKVGILPDTVDRVNFWRADVVLVSYAALGARLKNSDTTLAEKLINAGVFTEAQYAALTGTDKIAAQTDAIFRLDMYFFNGEYIGSATGVFISPDGYALTNFYAAANCYLYATTSDGKVSKASVKTVDCDSEGDLVLLKVDGVTVPYIEIGDASELVAGETIYTVDASGVPEDGHTVTENTVADPAAEAYGTTYVKPATDIYGDGTVVLNGDGELVGISVYYEENYIAPISRIESMNLSATRDLLYYLSYYLPDMGVLDFTTITGVELVDYVETPLGYRLQYDITDFHDMHDGVAAEHLDVSIAYYMLALETEGFETVEADGDKYTLATEDETVIISVENDGIYITARANPVCYDDFPTLPDFLWYFADGKSASESYVSEAQPGFVYRSYELDGYTADEQAEFLTEYVTLLETCDFTRHESTVDDGNLYYIKDDLFVSIFLDSGNFYIYISYLSE